MSANQLNISQSIKRAAKTYQSNIQNYNKKPFISIIIVENYYPDGKFIRCMKSYTNQTYSNYEIILVLWGKKHFNDILKMFKSNNINTERIKKFEYDYDIGYARGNNIGVSKSNGDFVLISNPDVETSHDFLERLVNSYNRLEKRKKIDKIMLGPRICNYNGKIEYSRRTINFLGFSNMDISKTNKIRRTMISSGCTFLIKKKHFESLNGFDEFYFMYHEDIDFSIRASLNGFEQYVDNSIHLYHLRSDEDYKLNRFKYFFHERNRLLMCLEHTKRKIKMIICQILFEPLHIIFALKKGFFTERLKVYNSIFKNFSKVLRNRKKENFFFDHFYEMDGVFNEIDSNKFILKILNNYARLLLYFYKH